MLNGPLLFTLAGSATPAAAGATSGAGYYLRRKRWLMAAVILFCLFAGV